MHKNVHPLFFSREKTRKRKRKKEKKERERESLKNARSGTRIGSIHRLGKFALERRKKNVQRNPPRRRRTCTASLVVTGDVVVDAISSCRLFPAQQHERKDGDKDQQTVTNFEDAFGIGTRRRLFLFLFLRVKNAVRFFLRFV